MPIGVFVNVVSVVLGGGCAAAHCFSGVVFLRQVDFSAHNAGYD